MLKPKFPPDLLEEILGEFPETSESFIRELADKNTSDSLGSLCVQLATDESTWMDWRTALAALREGRVEAVLEAAERAERIHALHERVKLHIARAE